MGFLSRIFAEVRQGENLDLYLTVIAAIGLAVLGLFGIAPANLIGPITLAVLGLIAGSSLRNRHQIDKLIEKFDNSSKNQFIEEFPANFDKYFDTSRSLTIVGTSLTSTLTKYYSTFERKAQHGDKIRFLLVHPEGSSLEMAASRALWETDIDKLRFKITSSLEIMCHIKRIAPDKVEIRTIKNPLSYAATLIDHGTSTSKGVVYVEAYSYKSPKPFIPKHIFYERDGEWYQFIASEIERLWENGSEWPCN